ncbi:hypothetical protein OSB04_031732 [Centaurea solstitialis]|uniref:Uncharacterized protein n=1 Tax=Centaurea solstitialis TaxID=347529 RepID=A0AA38W6A6_9ASTR|nr:hypothetical protein OSB04_031732 [Centaurea solstitialis]
MEEDMRDRSEGSLIKACRLSLTGKKEEYNWCLRLAPFVAKTTSLRSTCSGGAIYSKIGSQFFSAWWRVPFPALNLELLVQWGSILKLKGDKEKAFMGALYVLIWLIFFDDPTWEASSCFVLLVEKQVGKELVRRLECLV